MTIDYDKFCRRCRHYDFTMSDGILCALTHAQPDFENTCPDFALDPDREKQKQTRKKCMILA